MSNEPKGDDVVDEVARGCFPMMFRMILIAVAMYLWTT